MTDTDFDKTERTAYTMQTPRALMILHWTLRIALFAVFAFAGGTKLVGLERMVGVFADIGFGQWFRIFTGAFEVVGAVLLLHKATLRLGALMLFATMIGAVLTHLILVGGSFIPALILGSIALTLLLWRVR